MTPETLPLCLAGDPATAPATAFVFLVEGDTWNAPNVPQSKIQLVMFLSRLLSKAETG